ncbi:MAG TPA: hypothetical protein VGD98_06875 [Ktedonobacteraceae bacterium]
MAFPYAQYETLATQLTVYYPKGQAELAGQLAREVEQAGKLLGDLLSLSTPALEILVVASADWKDVPLEDDDETEPPITMLPYWTDTTATPTLVVPEQMDEIMGEASPQKRSLLLYHELAHAFLEHDPRPWPADSPLWADEWPLQFAAFWLFKQIHGPIEDITADLHQQFAESFEAEADGKTPVTVRGFDWYEDTAPEDYLEFVLLLENFATDLLARYNATILPRFLARYRYETPLLSDDVTKMLAEVLGEGGEEWLEELIYF